MPVRDALTNAGNAVFLSYASEDAVAAQRICDALRAAGIEVWFDKSELRGGDAWDRRIREQIHDCRLFIPIISTHSEARDEGYFRREWALAADRTRDMSGKKAFVLPVVIDDTRERGAAVPDKFHDIQWTRLPAGETTPTFATHVSRLLAQATGVTPQDNGGGASSAAGPPRRSRRPRWLATVAITAATGLLFMVGYVGLEHFQRTASSTVNTVPPAGAENSIAVLPFVDLSEKHDQEYFADGMAEEVLNLLTKIPGLKVTGRTSSFQFRGKSLDAEAIGAQLRVAYLLEGSVRRLNDQIRVTAQLLNARDSSHRWSNTYNARIDDVFQVQDAIAAAIARALELDIAGLAVPDRAAMGAEAYDKFMRGMHALDTSSREGCEQAIGLFSQVLRLQPDSERALISLARAHECMAYEDWGGPGSGFEQAREFAIRALKVNARSADAHLVLASVYIMHDYDWTAAAREIDTAKALADPDARALTIAARLSLALGQFDRSVELLHQAIALDPLDPLIFDILGDTYVRAGMFAKAEESYRRCLQIEPQFGIEHYYLGTSILLQGRPQEALVEAEKGSPGDGGYEAGRALIFHALGRPLEADRALKALIASSGNTWAYEVARVYAFRGQREQAFEWFDRAYQQRDTDLYYIKGDPLLRNLEGDPRYGALMRKMNLPE